ncbi:MAG: SUMF1/EgtB/PvdO family nonheme iron enzyme, partial [Phycisphaerae bacterium]
MKKAIAVLMVVFVAAFFAVAKEDKAPANATPKAATPAPTEKTIDLGNDVTLTLVLIPAGEFDMGSPMEELKRDDDEAQHHIKLTKSFYIGKFEVTQLQYR